MDPGNDNIIYAGGEKGVFKTTNGGASWTNVTKTIQGDIYDIVVDINAPNRVYAGSERGIYRSDDSGGSWKQLRSWWEHQISIWINPLSPSELVAKSYSSVYHSKDGGTTWSEIYNTQAQGFYVRSLTLNPLTRMVYLGTESGSVLQAKLK